MSERELFFGLNIGDECFCSLDLEDTNLILFEKWWKFNERNATGIDDLFINDDNYNYYNDNYLNHGNEKVNT